MMDMEINKKTGMLLMLHAQFILLQVNKTVVALIQTENANNVSKVFTLIKA